MTPSPALQRISYGPGLSLRRGAQLRPLDDFRLIAFDMDSTLITVETVDELADMAGRKAQIAPLTEAAMRGEQGVDFATGLRQRVALLAGTDAQWIEQVWTQRVRLTPGAQWLVAACRQRGLRCVLISGGFTCFADRVAQLLGLDEVHANVLGLSDGRLTGEVLTQPHQAFVDAEGKRTRLLQVCAQMGIAPQQAIAVGDGANDAPMLSAAGLSVAFHGKPVLRAQADVAIDSGGLDRLLELLR